jgi:hypothetical protein
LSEVLWSYIGVHRSKTVPNKQALVRLTYKIRVKIHMQMSVSPRRMTDVISLPNVEVNLS